MFLKKILLLSISLLFISCSHAVHQYHVSDQDRVNYSQAKHKNIKGEASRTVVMGFAFDTDYVNRAYADLASKCQNGRVTGINTRYSTSHGFFHWTNKIHMSALCLTRSSLAR